MRSTNWIGRKTSCTFMLDVWQDWKACFMIKFLIISSQENFSNKREMIQFGRLVWEIGMTTSSLFMRNDVFVIIQEKESSERQRLYWCTHCTGRNSEKMVLLIILFVIYWIQEDHTWRQFMDVHKCFAVNDGETSRKKLERALSSLSFCVKI